MAEEKHFQANLDGWSELVKQVIENVGVPKMQRVADACNQDLIASAMRRGVPKKEHEAAAEAGLDAVLARPSVQEAIVAVGKGYMVSVEGDDDLTKRDYRATVITASAAAMRHNAKNNTLIQHMNEAAG